MLFYFFCSEIIIKMTTIVIIIIRIRLNWIFGILNNYDFTFWFYKL